MWSKEMPQGQESLKCRWRIIPFTMGRGLDLGCGPDKFIPHTIGMDRAGADINGDITDLEMFADESMDYIFSSHALEDLEDTEKVLKEWWSKIKVGGYLVLYLPHKDFYPNIGKEGANPAHKHDFLPKDITDVMLKVGSYNLIRCDEHNEDIEYSFEMVLQKRLTSEQTPDSEHAPEHVSPLFLTGAVNSGIKQKLRNKVLVIRYGAFGDMIMASNVLRQLKEAGKHITMCTTPKGKAILKNDPNIDDWWLQEEDQVPNHMLDQYWHTLAVSGWWDEIVNLTQTVEETLLKPDYGHLAKWNPKALRRICDINYADLHSWVAGFNKGGNGKFYSSDDEKKWLESFLQPLRNKMKIVWCLSGSSLHKAWPFGEYVWGELANRKYETAILTVGSELERMLEVPYPGTYNLAGNISIRQSMILLEGADLIIGPETGLMNAAAGLSTKKIVMLSHSSPNNLTKYWKNTSSIEPDVPCYPCHTLHHSDGTCPVEEKTGAPVCAAAIHPQLIFAHIDKAYNHWRKHKIFTPEVEITDKLPQHGLELIKK